MTSLQDLFVEINALKSQFEETTRLLHEEREACAATQIVLTQCRTKKSQIEQQILSNQKYIIFICFFN
jgi:hypothetical protein